MSSVVRFALVYFTLKLTEVQTYIRNHSVVERKDSLMLSFSAFYLRLVSTYELLTIPHLGTKASRP